MELPSCAVVIVAAGSSRRMGFDKLMADLWGRPVLAHSIEAFAKVSSTSEIIVVTDDDRYQGSLKCLNDLPVPISRVDGGAERHHSVSNGLEAIRHGSDYVAVHDGARPLVTKQAVEASLSSAAQHGAAACAHPITETIKRANESQFVTGSVDRTNLWAMETPQTFRLDLLRRAYSEVLASGLLVTDEVSAMDAIGIPTHLVMNQSDNPKITYPSDLERLAQV